MRFWPRSAPAEWAKSIARGTRSWGATSHAPHAPAELQRIVSKALHKNRDERYQAHSALAGG
jgi:hypothetical protein